MKYEMPKMEHKFQIQVKGEETGINWVGDFTYKRPTLSERSQIDAMRASLGRDLRTLDPDVVAYNEAISTLRFTLKEFPEWWQSADFGGSLYDANVVLSVYTKCMEFEAEWIKKMRGGDANEVAAP